MLNISVKNQTKKSGFRLGAIALSVTALLLSGCNQPEEISQTNTTTEEVTEETEQLIGETVTIRSDVAAEVGDASFTLQSDEFFGGEEILVVNATGTAILLPPDDTPVQVTGEVVQFVLADIESEYGLGLDPELYVEYEEQPAIIAESVALAPEPEELAEDPAAYYNQVVAVEGEVAEVYSPSTFTVGEEGWFSGGELLVVGVDPEFSIGDAAVEEGEYVTVTGVLRPYVSADFERDYDLTWDLDLQQQIEAEYTETPVLAATEVYPSAIEE
ncbi:MAG: hypothetical protein ACFB4I_01600 [Cyanophyceae cyanobacterium]